MRATLGSAFTFTGIPTKSPHRLRRRVVRTPVQVRDSHRTRFWPFHLGGFWTLHDRRQRARFGVKFEEKFPQNRLQIISCCRPESVFHQLFNIPAPEEVPDSHCGPAAKPVETSDRVFSEVESVYPKEFVAISKRNVANLSFPVPLLLRLLKRVPHFGHRVNPSLVKPGSNRRMSYSCAA